MTDATVRAPAAYLRIGARAIPIEPDRIYVLGSGEKADVRVVHDSVRACHATFSAHAGRLRVEDLGEGGETFVGGVRLHGAADVPSGSTLRLGGVEIEVVDTIERARPTLAAAHAPTPFSTLMADELRRAPWFGLSILLHAIAFLVLWLLLADRMAGDRGRRVVTMEVVREEPTEEFGENEADSEEFEVEEVQTDEIELQELELKAPEVPEEQFSFEDPSGFAPDLFGGSSGLQRIAGGAGDDILKSVGGEGGSVGFRRTVEGLRESGLEIVFVFDSTGSMGPVLAATRKRLTLMLETLVALVPDVRVGVVTYRDHGEREDYVTRGVPLARDLYRAINFMQTVDAAGGGDRPEAVLDALQAAVAQGWKPKARRVIVLVGDAPAHADSERKLERLLREFTRDKRSFVHAIMTAPTVLGGIDPKTEASFEDIARAGRGVCLPLEREETILRELLTLAIGSDFREEVQRVFGIVESREIPVSRSARRAVDDADQDRIEHLLSRPTIPQDFMQLLTQSRDVAVAQVLIRVLTDDRVPERGRQAASFALQRMLGLRQPPAPVERGARLNAEEAKALYEVARKALG